MDKDEDFMEPKKNIFKIILPILGVILIVVGSIFLLTRGNGSSKEETVSLKDDYYESINKSNYDSPFSTAQSTALTNYIGLIQQIEMENSYTDDNYYKFVELFEDMNERDQKGLDGLQTYFDQIDNAKTLDEFSDIVIKVNYDLGVSTFINFGMMADLYDNSKNVALFGPIVLEDLNTFSFTKYVPNGLDYFANEKYSTYKEAFEQARVDYFKLYGYDEEKAKELSSAITEFAKTIQEKSISLDEYKSNYMEYYKNYSLSEIKGLFKNLPIEKFLKKYNLNNYEYFAIIDVDHYKALDNYYTEEHLPLMKEILRLMILEKVASYYTTTEYATVLANTMTKIIGEKLNASYALLYYNLLYVKAPMMDSFLDTKYDENYFTEIEKQEIIELINKIKDHYKEVIKNSEWLSDSTKEEAIKKLDNMKVNVGYVHQETIEPDVTVVAKEDGGTLIGNYILYSQGQSSVISKILKSDYKETMDQYLANAYYDPSDNSINFPTAFREIYRGFNDKYEMYGSAGMIIAHEISHAFDNKGSQYDEKGNLKNWWTEEDLAKFNDLKKSIIDYYSNYEVFGLKVDGEITVAENIADLAAVKTLLSIMEDENATNDDYKKFFEAYAKLWNEKTTKEELEREMITDDHSPNKVRVNAVLSSMDKFYEVYDIKESDKMYVAKDNRVGLW